MSASNLSVEKLLEDRAQLIEALEYLLAIKNRQHPDDYAYDDGWKKAQNVLNKVAKI